MKNTDKLFSIVADGGDDKQRSNKTSIAKRLAMAAVLAGQLAAPAHASVPTPGSLSGRIAILRDAMTRKLAPVIANGPTSHEKLSYPERQLAQWVNWSNWGNWNNWSNWDNWRNWANAWTNWTNI